MAATYTDSDTVKMIKTFHTNLWYSKLMTRNLKGREI
jgi:hypothetical protein